MTDLAALLQEVDELPNPRRSLLTENEALLIDFCHRLAAPLRELVAPNDADVDPRIAFLLRGANDALRRAERAEAELSEVKALLADPVAVYVNVLRGSIAKPEAWKQAEAERDRLQEALEPFAVYAKWQLERGLPRGIAEDDSTPVLGDEDWEGRDCCPAIYVADLKRAAKEAAR